MLKIEGLLSAALEGKPVAIAKNGEWYVQGSFKRIICWLVPALENRRIYAVAEKILTDLEIKEEITKTPDKRLIEAVRKAAGPYFNVQHELNEKQIRKTCKHPRFAAMLILDNRLKKEYFNWIFNKFCPPKIYIFWPDLAKKIRASHVDVVGHFAYKKHLRVVNGDPCLRINGVMTPILSEAGKRLLENWKNGESGVFGTFRLIQEEGFTDEGVDAQSVDLNKPEWWKDLKAFEVISREAAEKRYSIEIKPGEWVFQAGASRKSNEEYMSDCHGHFQILMPLEGGEKYRVFSIEKYMKVWPRNVFQTFASFGDTREAIFTLYGPTPFYLGHRNVSYISLNVDEAVGLELMQKVAELMKRSLAGNEIFQFLNDNCAAPVQLLADFIGELTGREVPRYYRKPVIELKSQIPVLNFIFASVRAVPKFFQPCLTAFYNELIGFRRGIYIEENGKKVFKSAATGEYNETKEIHLPSELCRKVVSGELPGATLRSFQEVQL